MFSKNSMRIIEFLLRNLNREFNVNQIARNLKISVGSAHKILKSLASKNFINFRKMGNAIFYKLNLENKETQKICEIALIESKNKELSFNPVAKVYAKDIETFGDAKAMILFGSILVKKEKAGDVDVLFVIEDKKAVKKVNEFCLEISKTKTKSIVPLIITERDLKGKFKSGDKVLLEILKTGIILSGEDVIIKSIKDD